MEWTKIPTDLLQSRLSDKEIIAITKYQLLWAMLEREPSEDICLRYMTPKQLQQALNYTSAIECRVNADIKSVESNRHRQKLFYEKNQQHSKKPNGQTNGYTNAQTNVQTNRADKIREDKKKEIYKERSDRFDEFWEKYKPVKGKDGTIVNKGSRSDCYNRYSRIIRDVDEQTIIDGLERYLTYCRESNICSCGAAVFLNQRRWEYEYEVQNKTARFDKPMSEWTNDDYTAYSVYGGRG